MGPAPSWGPAPSCVTPPPSSLLFPVSPLWSHLGALAQCPPPSHPPLPPPRQVHSPRQPDL